MLFNHDVPVIPGRPQFVLWGGAHDGATREVRPYSDDTWPVVNMSSPDAVYVYRADTGRYEHEWPAVR